MRANLEATLRAKGASDTLVRALKAEGMLSPRGLEAVATRALRASGASGRGLPRDRRGPARSGRASASRQAEAPSANRELLAAIALTYL